MPPKKKSKALPRAADLDRISNVPGNVVDQILSYLPIKDAVRTSVLSTKWRNRWATIPSLVFNDKSFPLPLDSQGVDMPVKNLVMGIDRILLLHSGPIDKFELSYEHNIPDDDVGIYGHDYVIADDYTDIPNYDIDRWILYLSRHSIKELVCFLGKHRRYQMPSYLFSCQNLTHLGLIGCHLRPPSAFKSFKELKSLDLRHMTLTPEVLDYMISSSPLLERLTLHGVFSTLNVKAPNLRFVVLNGVFAGVNLKNTPRLAEFTMFLSRSSGYENFVDHRNWIKVFENMPRVSRLDVRYYSIEYMASGFIPHELAVPCVNLRTLIVDVNLTSFNETAVLLCLLRSAPNLQDLEINSFWHEIFETSGEIWEADKRNRSFTCLRNVKIVIDGINGEIDFIKFMLLTSPSLQMMTVTLSAESNVGGVDKFELVKQLLRFSRASTQAEIVFLEE